MKKSLFTHLALAGIASGMLSVSAQAETAKPTTAPAKVDSAKHSKHHEKKMEMKAEHAMADSSKPMADSGKTAVAAPKSTKHDCKGLNACKGQGGCAMTGKDIESAAKKMGMPVEKAGKAHECKGHNDCKGLGGCKAS